MLDERAAALARRLPFALSVLRIALGPAYVLALETSAGLPLAIALLAAASDFVDGRLARRLGVASRTGAVMDVVGDGTFVLVAQAALAELGVISWLLPGAVALSLSRLALSTWHGRGLLAASSASRRRGPADRAGHYAGIVNYAVVLAGSAAVAGWVDTGWLPPTSVAVAMLNLAPLALRIAPPSGRSGRGSSRSRNRR